MAISFDIGNCEFRITPVNLKKYNSPRACIILCIKKALTNKCYNFIEQVIIMTIHACTANKQVTNISTGYPVHDSYILPTLQSTSDKL